MSKGLETCKFCGDTVVWETVRVGHGPDYEYKDVPISIEPDPKGTVVKYQEEWQVPGAKRIEKFPLEVRYRRHGYVPCVRMREKVS